jgi:hypothetical protein
MPFSGASDPNLPSNVEGLSLEKRQQWVGAWNSRFADCRSDGGTTESCESTAFAVANAAIKEVAVVEDKAKNMVDIDFYDYMTRQINQKSAEYDPTGGTAAKACSNCQWFISPAACAIVEGYPDPIVPNGISNLWRERVDRFADPDPLEVIIVGEREAQVGDKAETKTEGGVSYPAADYAVVPDGDKPSGWKLRLAEGNAGNVTVAQVARAITAMQPGGFRGNRVSLSSDQKSQAVGRIGRAIGRTGGTDEQKTNLRERLDGVKATADWFEFLVTGPRALGGAIKAALLKMQPTRSAPDGVPDVESVADPVTYDSSLTLFKDHDGDLRFVALMSNRYRDRDKEIIPAAAHEEFVAALDAADYKNAEGKPAMEAWLWHTPGTKWGEVDWAHFVNGFMIVSGPVDKGCEDVAQRLAADRTLGVSHGFRYLTDAADPSIITQYRAFEFSPLPRAVASNPYTDLAVIQEEVKAMGDDKRIPDEKRAFLADKLGDQRVTGLEGDTAKQDDALQTAGIDFKNTDGAADGTPAGTDTVQALAEAAVKAVTESKVMTDMAEAVKAVADGYKALDLRLRALERTDDAKMGDLFRSRVGTVADQRASQSDGNVVEKAEAEKEGAGPGTNIFEEITENLARDHGIKLGV